MSHYRKGDIVTIRGVVKYDADKDGDVYIRPDGHYTDVMVPVESVSIVQQAVEVGDTVQDTGGFSDADFPADVFPHVEVVAMHEGYAWLRSENGGMATVAICRLSRVEKSDE